MTLERLAKTAWPAEPRIIIWYTCLAIVFIIWSSHSPVHAQLPATRLDGVFPAGGNPGQTIELTLAGANLDDVAQLQFSHPGITAVQKTADPGPFDKGPQPVPNTFLVTIAANVPLGVYDLRCHGKYGMSNPRAIEISDLPEKIEKEPNNEPAQASELQWPLVINGQLQGGSDVDLFPFAAKTGQRIIFDGRARRLDSRADCVLTILDAAGHELMTARDRQSGDPLLDFDAPSDGTYYLKVHDALFGGGPEYVYRVAVGILSHIDFVFPPAGLPGTNGPFTVYGRNLPGGQPAGIASEGRPLQKMVANIAIPSQPSDLPPPSVRIDPEQAGLDAVEYRIQGEQGLSNSVLVTAATAPGVHEIEPNSTPDKAQPVTVPCELWGQFFPARDSDWFSWRAKQGDVFIIELYSHRLGRPTDATLLVQQVTKNEKGEEQVTLLANADDFGTRDGGPDFDARTTDPVFRLVAPVEGTYRVMVRDGISALRSEPQNVYRLAIRQEKPDFKLIAIPGDSYGALLLRKGGQAIIRIMAIRQDYFVGEIQVAVSGLPAGITCPPVVIGPTSNTATLVLHAAENAPTGAATIQVVGQTKIGSADVKRIARAGTATLPMPLRQPNQPEISVPARVAREIVLSVSDGEVAPVAFQAGEGKVWETSCAGILKIPYTVTRRAGYNGRIDSYFTDLPANVEAPVFGIDPGKTAGEFQINLRNNTPTGTYTFYLSGFVQQVPYSRNPEGAKVAAERKAELEKIANETAAAAKSAADAKTAADKLVAETTAAARAATDAKAVAEKAAMEAETAAKAAVDKVAQAKAAAAANSNDTNLAAAVTAAEKAAAEAAVKAKPAAEALTASQKALEVAAANAKAAAEAKTAADKVAEQAAAKAKLAADLKVAADQRAAALENAAKPQNLNYWTPSTSIQIKITPAPITVTPPPESLPVKQGAMVELPVSINRLYGYADAINVTVMLPNGVGGLQIPAASIANGQNQGKLAITAAADATVGSHRATLRSSLRLNNQDLVVDQPFNIVVEKVEKTSLK